MAIEKKIDQKRFEKMVKENTTKIIKLRRNNLELIYGDIIILYSDDASLVYARKYFDNVSIIAFNKSGQDKDIKLILPESLQYPNWTANFKNDFSLEDSNNQLVLKLKPYTFEILTNRWELFKPNQKKTALFNESFLILI